MDVRGALEAVGAGKIIDGPTPLSGGFSAELYAFSATDPDGVVRPLVLRLTHDAAGTEREVTAHQAARAGGFPAPAVRLHGNERSPFGRPFIVMDRVDGRTPMAAAGVRGIPRLFRELPELLGRTMAQLHDVAIDCDIGDATDAMLAEVRDDENAAWLERNRASATARVLCHCDLHGENLLVADGQLQGVVDWELATVAPPELDVARTRLILALLPGVSSAARAVLKRSAARTSDRFTASYEELRPLDPTRLQWYDVLWAARQAAVAEGSGAVADVWGPLRGPIAARATALRDQ